MRRQTATKGLRITAATAILWALLGAGTAHALSGRVADRAGDAYGGYSFADMTALQMTDAGSSLTFRIDFATSRPEGIHGSILLDLDGDRRTTGANAVPEASIDFHIAILGICQAQYFGPPGGPIAVNLSCWLSRNSFYVRLTARLGSPVRRRTGARRASATRRRSDRAD